MSIQKDPLEWINSIMKDGETLDDFLKTLKFTSDQVHGIFFGVDPGSPEGDREIRVTPWDRGFIKTEWDDPADDIEDLVLVNGVYQVRAE
jgi:hypothetical protein